MPVDSAEILRTLLTQAREAASAYQAAQQSDMPEQEARWLRQGADEHQQNVRLLEPHIESLLSRREPGTWPSAVAATKAKVASWLGHEHMLGQLTAAERALTDTLGQALAVASLPVELKALCEDQQACAKTRLSQLRQREKAAQHPGAKASADKGGPLGHKADTLNKPKPVSSENSDC